ncbi:ATP-binding cassette sub-family G member 1-like isoform X2 [Melanaphis sacchari]|uniref:ATP-binding cassette sub-family G member 1-like isoform X2 n=1 Tax=Melanaphis sacchari TaxID=742174 RepID=UPI000DC13A4C|nr:ATP-binding cassette sub-family G member 1-like isoform X2 [Melanaphis sacchari]
MFNRAKCRRTENNNEDKSTTELQSFSKKPEVHLSFESLTYTVNTYRKLKKVKNEILHGIDGCFRSGQLTAIMGPSGCGKSTLLNVLAGYSISGSSGQVYLNGSLRDEKQMTNISCYIQQDDYVRDLLTVRESMTVAAHLKLPTTLSAISKADRVEVLLDALGLSVHGDTITKRLSGGQKKKLSIALELITNPSILFLDEPTTGLDSQSCSHLVSLMINLAHNENRTIVCTLHQPSALLFEKFDQVYVLSSGRCIYQGPPKLVIPYFAEHSVICPPYHNPADLYACQKNNIDNKFLPYKTEILNKPPFYIQIYHLFWRNIIMYRRNKTNALLRLVVHLVVALTVSYLYRGVGNDAARVLNNTKFVFGTNLFLAYTGLMAVVVSFPLEYIVLKREHFNGWYTLFPYMISVLLIEIPLQISCCLVYIIPAYIITGQPLEIMRFSYFAVFLVATSLTSQSAGFLCGTTMPLKVSVFVGPVSLALLSVFGFAIRLPDIPVMYVWLHHFSFVRASFQSLLYSLYGFTRGVLPCSNEYCHYKNPVKFLTEMAFNHCNINPELLYVCFFFLCTYVLTITVIWYKLNKR